MAPERALTAPVASPGRLAVAARPLERRDNLVLLLFLLPCTLLLVLVFFLPLVQFLSRAFLDPDPTLRHFRRLVASPEYLAVLGRTLRVSAITTTCCVVLGYPLAYVIATASSWTRAALLALVLIPFWTSVLVRMFAWMALLGTYGVVNGALMAAGLVTEPLRLLFTETAVVIGMTHYLLPYMILPCVAVMSAIPPNLMLAAEGLGAPRWRAVLRIYMPLSVTGLSAGCLLVFIISLGFFVTPALLGGPGDVMLAQLIEHQASQQLDWGMAAALSVVLLAVTMLLYAAYARLGVGEGFRDA